MSRSILLGADPSFNNFGSCLYWPSNKKMILNTDIMQNSVKWINATLKANGASLKDVIAFVEDPGKDSTVFGIWHQLKKQIEAMQNYQRWVLTGRRGAPPIKVVMADVESLFRRSQKIAQDVGRNKESARQFCLMLEKANVPYVTVAPSKRDKAFKEEINYVGGKRKKSIRRLNVKMLINPTKTTQGQFKELTGYDKRSTEHERDGATLVYGKSIRNAEHLAFLAANERRSKPASYPSPKNGNYKIVSR